MNPFVQNIKLTVVQVNDNYVLTTTAKNSTSPAPRTLTIPNSYLIEKAQKTSIFHLPNINQVLFGDLKAAGRDLFLYITINLKRNLDYIELVHRPVCESMDISRGTLHSALIQLTQAGIICKRDPKTYWINPLYMFNGNRIDYFKALGDDFINIVAIV